MRTAVDTNVISALWSAEPLASGLSAVLETASAEGALVVCGAVYAELLAYPKNSAKFTDDFLESTGIAIDFDFGEAVWREVALRFAKYAGRRRSSRGNHPKRLLTDFIVGAHALVCADRLLTLDGGCYDQDFPDLPRVQVDI